MRLLSGVRHYFRYSRQFVIFASRRRHTTLVSDWSSDVCSSDLDVIAIEVRPPRDRGEGVVERVDLDLGVAEADDELLAARPLDDFRVAERAAVDEERDVCVRVFRQVHP